MNSISVMSFEGSALRSAGVSLALTQDGPAVLRAMEIQKSPAGRRRQQTPRFSIILFNERMGDGKLSRSTSELFYFGIFGTTRCKSLSEAPSAACTVAHSDGARYTPAPFDTS